MSREIRFTATDEEYAEVLAYVTGKRRWRKVSHFLRDACFQAMDRNPVGRHDLRHGAIRTERIAGMGDEGA